MQTKRRVYKPPPIPPAINPRPVSLPAPDMERAREDAAKTLASIDFSRPVIVLWLPGTNRSGVPQTFAGPAQAAWGADASIVELMYPASYDLRQGVATGMETLRLVLAGIAAHTGRRYVVHLAGESQGAWAITEVMADPRARRQVSRVALMSNPSPASRHFVDGHDPGIMEMSRRVDLVARPINGDVEAALQAAEGVIGLDPLLMLRSIPALVRVAVANPGSAALLAGTALRLMTPGGRDRDPHNYEDMMPAAVRFLHVGYDSAATRGAFLVNVGVGRSRSRGRRAHPAVR